MSNLLTDKAKSIPIILPVSSMWEVIGRPVDLSLGLDGLVSDVIRPALEKAGIQWHGWHAFRRGLATNLNRLGVQDKVNQAILRHSNVSVTQRAYIKTVDSDAVNDMQKLEHRNQYATGG